MYNAIDEFEGNEVSSKDSFFPFDNHHRIINTYGDNFQDERRQTQSSQNYQCLVETRFAKDSS